MEITGVGYIGLESIDAKSWEEYATDLLGMELNTSRDDGAVYLRMDDRHHRIAVRAGETNRLAYIGWELADHFAFEDGLKALSDAGLDPQVGDSEMEELRGVHGVASYTDPGGLPNEIFYGQYFNPGSFRAGRRHAGFLAGDKGLGHVVTVVPELSPELQHYCRDVMEFDWFGHGLRKGFIEFYRGNRNPESHNVGFAAAPGVRGLQHIGIYCNELDDVGIAYDMVQERGLPISRTLGRHAQDPVVSFYSYAPDGLEVEYIWNDGNAYFPHDTFLEQRAEVLSVWGHKEVDARRSTYLNAAE